MNAEKNAGMVFRAETGQSYLQETSTWRIKQSTKLGEWCWKEIEHFFFFFLIGDRK